MMISSGLSILGFGFVASNEMWPLLMAGIGFSCCGGLSVRGDFGGGDFGGVFGDRIAFLCRFSIFC